eukprot:snap_masked-scaffold_33-processed-gene-0.20-mRNA-1 protein AED:1.00 eAED:1.00 QI:0/-1/0/0/-1/1/1/0/580
MNDDADDRASLARTSLYLHTLLLTFSIFTITASQVADSLTSAQLDQVTTAGVFSGFTIILALPKILFSLDKSSEKYNIDTCCTSNWNILFALSLLIIWVTAVCIFTFAENGLFKELGTGYFSTWALLLTSSYLLFHERQVASSNFSASASVIEALGDPSKYRIFILGVGLASIGLLAVSSIECSGTGCSTREAFAVIFAVCQLVLLGFVEYILYTGHSDLTRNFKVLSQIALGLLLISFSSVAVFSVYGFFSDAQIANGFITTFASFFFSYGLLSAFTQMTDVSDSQFLLTHEVTHIAVVLMYIIGLMASTEGEDYCSDQVLRFEEENRTRTFVNDCDDFRMFALVQNSIYFVVIVLSFCLFHATNSTETSGPYRLAQILAVGQFISAMVLTFPTESPFSSTSAGYVSSWGALILLIRWGTELAPNFATNPNTFAHYLGGKVDYGGYKVGMGSESGGTLRWSFALMLGCLIVLLAVIVTCIFPDEVSNGLGECDMENGELWVILSCVLTFLLFMILLCASRMASRGKLPFRIKTTLVLLWTLNAGFFTLRGPFENIQGNGFYGTWFTLVAAVNLFTNHES